MPELERYVYECGACGQIATSSPCSMCVLRLKYYAALRAYRQRAQETPSSERRASRSGRARRLRTWRDWFGETFGESLTRFGERSIRERTRERIRRYELATLGVTAIREESDVKAPKA